MNDFDGKTMLVTGGGSGIGRACVELLARRGARVGVLDKNPDRVADVASRVDGAVALPCDVTDDSAVAGAVARLVGETGGLHGVVVSAGINGVWAPIDDLTPDEWDATMNVNLRGTFLTLRHAVGPLREAGGGGVVVVSSGQGTRNFNVPGSTAYACSKAAQVALVKKLAVELAQSKIRVNAVCPGSTRTDINATVVKRDLDRVTWPVLYPRGKVILNDGRGIDASHVADLVAFLCSDAAAMITGSEVWIDGGMSLVMG